MAALNTVSKEEKAVVIIDRFSYAYPGAELYTLRDISLTILPGECHLLKGPTGSGKTTLLMALRDLLPPGHQTGMIHRFSPSTRTAAASPGLIRQNPKTQLLCSSLGADIAFGLENHCVPPAQMAGLIEDTLDTVGLKRPFSYPVERLSMGQQYRTCLAGQLVMNPQLVMMDEPVAQLDPRGREKLLEVIRKLKLAGRAVLICEHRSDLLESVVDCSWELTSDGRLSDHVQSNCSTRQIYFEKDWSHPTSTLPIDSVDADDTAENPILRIDGLKFAHEYGELDLSHLSFNIAEGTCIAISGPNGSGKTTLLRAMAGIVQPAAGTVEVFGVAPKLSQLRGSLAVLYQDPAKQLFETTVFNEVAFSALRNGLAPEQVRIEVEALLGQLCLLDLAEASPHTLSYGQKHLVGIAAVLAAKPKILLLDDPFAGLDTESVNRVITLVTRFAKESGTTVIWTSHDPADLNNWADHVIDLAAAHTAKQGASPQAFPSENDISKPPSKRKLRMNTGVMLSLCMVLSMLAFAARSPELLFALGTVNLLLVTFLGRDPLRVIKKSMLLFLWQAALVLLLYTFRFGFAAGAVPGFQVASQLFLAFWPGMIFMASNSQPRIARTLSRVLPQRIAFVSATCLRFLPMLLAEMQQIRETQILRGAKLLTTDLNNPKYWPDWLRCLLVPTLIKTLSLAEDIATAATARDFDIHPKRTSWPGD